MKVNRNIYTHVHVHVTCYMLHAEHDLNNLRTT